MVIKKQVGERLGMNIKGGVQGSPGNPLDKSDEGVFISKINSNGAVHRDGRLKVMWCSRFFSSALFPVSNCSVYPQRKRRIQRMNYLIVLSFVEA